MVLSEVAAWDFADCWGAAVRIEESSQGASGLSACKLPVLFFFTLLPLYKRKTKALTHSESYHNG